ncbi:hypothetical protein HOG48_04805 [Candidatus Peregrinibacteria bacterium]|jgi:serine/threonine protein phosphatase PrpC|nr:hypothetical protein [Candidatus Peregrinibacteria bacterium]
MIDVNPEHAEEVNEDRDFVLDTLEYIADDDYEVTSGYQEIVFEINDFVDWILELKVPDGMEEYEFEEYKEGFMADLADLFINFDDSDIVSYVQELRDRLGGFKYELDLMGAELEEEEEPRIELPEIDYGDLHQRGEFAHLVEANDTGAVLAQYSLKERLAILDQVSEEAELTPRQVEQIEFLGAIVSFLDFLIRDYEGRESFTDSFELIRDKKIGEWKDAIIEDEYDEVNLSDLMDDLEDSEVFIGHAEYDNYGKTFYTFLCGLGAIGAAEGLGFYQGERQLSPMEYRLRLVRWMRRSGRDEEAGLMVEETLAEEFAKGREEMKDERPALRKEALMDISEELSKPQRSGEHKGLSVYEIWDEAGIPQESQDDIVLGLIESVTDSKMNEMVAREYLKKDMFTGMRRDLWLQYHDMVGIGVLNFSDDTVRMIVREVAINVPLILISGGLANAARAGVTKGLSITASRILGAARFARLARQAGYMATAGLLPKATYYGTRLGSRAVGLLFEGAVFDATYMIIQGENPFQEGWMQRVLWTSAALGMFKGAGSLSKNVMGKGTCKLTKRAAAGIELTLSKYLPRVADRQFAMGVSALMVSGHMEVAAMLMLAAMQKKYFSLKDEEEEMDWEWADEILHAYVVVGALKIGGGVVHVGGRAIEPNGGRGEPVIRRGRERSQREIERAEETARAEAEAFSEAQRVMRLESAIDSFIEAESSLIGARQSGASRQIVEAVQRRFDLMQKKMRELAGRSSFEGAGELWAVEDIVLLLEHRGEMVQRPGSQGESLEVQCGDMTYSAEYNPSLGESGGYTIRVKMGETEFFKPPITKKEGVEALNKLSGRREASGVRDVAVVDIAKEGIPEVLRSNLRDPEISYERHGEMKTTTVSHEGKTYKFCQDSGSKKSWVKITDAEGKFLEQIFLERAEDIRFIEGIFKLDVTETLRISALDSGKVVYKEGKGEVLVVEGYGRKTYEFHRDASDRVVMEVFDSNGYSINSVRLKTASDVESVEMMFGRYEVKESTSRVAPKPEPEVVRRNAELGPRERVAETERVIGFEELGRKLDWTQEGGLFLSHDMFGPKDTKTFEQHVADLIPSERRESFMEKHEGSLRRNRENGREGEYTPEQVYLKRLRLERSGFSRPEARTIIEHGLAGFKDFLRGVQLAVTPGAYNQGAAVVVPVPNSPGKFYRGTVVDWVATGSKGEKVYKVQVVTEGGEFKEIDIPEAGLDRFNGQYEKGKWTFFDGNVVELISGRKADGKYNVRYTDGTKGEMSEYDIRMGEEAQAPSVPVASAPRAPQEAPRPRREAVRSAAPEAGSGAYEIGSAVVLKDGSGGFSRGRISEIIRGVDGSLSYKVEKLGMLHHRFTISKTDLDAYNGLYNPGQNFSTNQGPVTLTSGRKPNGKYDVRHEDGRTGEVAEYDIAFNGRELSDIAFPKGSRREVEEPSSRREAVRRGPDVTPRYQPTVVGRDYDTLGLARNSQYRKDGLETEIIISSDRGPESKYTERSPDGKVTHRNEDRVVYNPRTGRTTVIDGMGGQGHGDRAAEIFAQELGREPDLNRAIQKTQERYRAEFPDGKPGVVFASTSVVEVGGQKSVEFEWAGDVTAYLIDGSTGRCRQITRPDTPVQDTIDRGGMDWWQGVNSPMANIVSNALKGDTSINVHSVTIPVKAGDRVVVATDGFELLGPAGIRDAVGKKNLVDALDGLDTAQSTKTDDNGYLTRDNRGVAILDIK